MVRTSLESKGETPYVTLAVAAKIAKVTSSRIQSAILQGWLTPVEGIVEGTKILLRSDVEAWRDREKPPGGRGQRLNHAVSSE
jgi:hypothetical protein